MIEARRRGRPRKHPHLAHLDDAEYARRRSNMQRKTRKYGVDPDDYERRLKRQDGRCAICRRPFPGRIAIDHCHITMVVRGLLCTSCNTALGKFGDDPEVLRRAIAYLEKSR